MANDLNRCEFIGHLGKDVDLRYLPSGAAVASFSIACNESWKDKNTGEKQERVEWLNISAFGKLAEICGKFLKKGQQVYIAGKFRTEKYEKDGQTKYITKIVANEMQMLGGKGNAESTGTSAEDYQKASGGSSARGKAAQDFDDEIPF